MKITEIRTRVVQWRGKTVPLPPHFCTNPMDVIAPMLTRATMGTFTFHGWVLVEIFTDAGLVGIGNAALSPQVTKQVIDLYLKPLLLGAVQRGPGGEAVEVLRCCGSGQIGETGTRLLRRKRHEGKRPSDTQRVPAFKCHRSPCLPRPES